MTRYSASNTRFNKPFRAAAKNTAGTKGKTKPKHSPASSRPVHTKGRKITGTAGMSLMQKFGHLMPTF